MNIKEGEKKGREEKRPEEKRSPRYSFLKGRLCIAVTKLATSDCSGRSSSAI